jgi:hypothetical protein
MTFKYWMEKYFVPQLKSDNTTRNMFIKDLHIDRVTNDFTGQT